MDVHQRADCLHFVPLVVVPQIEAGAAEVDVVLADLVPQQPAGGRVVVSRAP